MRTETERAAPTAEAADAAPCEEIVAPTPITVKVRSLEGVRTIVDDLGDALDRLPCREDPRHGIMVDARLERPRMSDTRAEAQRAWYWENICMDGCDHYRADCLESDRLAECMANMDYRLRLEMNEAVPRFRNKQEYEEERADAMHSSGEEVP